MAEIKGLDKLLSKLEAIGGNSTHALEIGIKQATKKVQGDAKSLCIPDTGRLRNSIQATTERKGNKVIGKVHTNVEYAAYVEFGTGQRGEDSPSPPKYDGNLAYKQDWAGMVAKPFLYPALKQNQEQIKDIIKKYIKEEIRKVAR